MVNIILPSGKTSSNSLWIFKVLYRWRLVPTAFPVVFAWFSCESCCISFSRDGAKQEAFKRINTSGKEENMIAFKWKNSIHGLEITETRPLHQHGEFVDPENELQTISGLPFNRSEQELVSAPSKLSTSRIFSTNSTSVLGIDQIHRRGLIHTGVWMYIIDNQRRILLSKRGPSMVTCPNRWMLLGEHSMVGEELQPDQTVLRGVREEIESFAVDDTRYFKRQHNLMTRNHGGNPVYFELDYGPQVGNRIDRQVTYFWLVEFRVEGEAILQRMQNESLLSRKRHSEESTLMRWVRIHELEEWLVKRPTDFCHETIHSFFRIGMRELRLEFGDD